MDALQQKKITEANQHILDAEKFLKTSFFKRKPDLDSAATSYSKAGQCFKIAKSNKEAIDNCIKAGDCYKENNSLYNAAKQYEQAGLMANEIKNYKLAYEMFEKSTELMITNGTRDSAGIILERGANLLKINAPEQALNLYKRAIHVAEVEEKYHESLSYFENAINLSIRISNFDEAVDLVDKLLIILDKFGTQEQITKYILTVALIYLQKDDWVSAKKYLDNMKQRYELPASSRGFGKVDDLLQAYDEKDNDKFQELIKNYLSYAVDNEALKIANKIINSSEWINSVKADSGVKETNRNAPNQSYSQASSNIEAKQSDANNFDNDIDEEGLL